ncbi:MAG TPA: metallophosphoesterase, partial [Candidatus Xenobia bacterium]
MTDRREFLKCMAWAGTGVLFSVRGGVLSSSLLGEADAASADFSFVQISDSHIGFNKPANPDVVGTFQQCIDRVNALPVRPAFVVHTGDLTHGSKPEEFDTVQKMLATIKAPEVHVIPGEHDTVVDDGQAYQKRFGTTWYSFDTHGVHCVALVNVLDLKAGGMGHIGDDQMAWLEKDLRSVRSDTPLVVFAHMPLWTIDRDWGWGTDESEQVMGHLKRFGSVTVLNGHIHQAIGKVEGHVTFHTALSTAYPQPAPGTAPHPGPLKVDRLARAIGVTSIRAMGRRQPLAVIDGP